MGVEKFARFLQACEGKNWQIQPGLYLEIFFLNFEMVRMSFVALQVQVQINIFSFKFAAGRAIFQTFPAYIRSAKLF